MSPYFSSGLVLTNSHQCPIPSISVDGHACSESFIHHQQDVTFCPIHIQRPSSPTVSPVPVQGPVVSTSAIVGYTNPVGYGLPHIPALVSKTNSDDRRSVTSSGTQPVLFTDASLKGWGASWNDNQISGLWSAPESLRHINWLELEAIRLALLQWGPQWRHHSVRVYCDNSTAVAYIRKQVGGTHSQSLFYKTLELFDLLYQFVITLNSHTPPRSQERHGRCSVPHQSTQPDRVASSNRNLEQSVLCLRNSPDKHVCHSGEQGNARLCFSLPGRQSMGGRRPVPIMGRFGTSLCISSGSHCSQNSPENKKISGHHGHHDCITTSIQTVASTSPPVEHTSSNPSPGRNLFQYVPNLRRPQYHRNPRLLDLAAWNLSGTS